MMSTQAQRLQRRTHSLLAIALGTLIATAACGGDSVPPSATSAAGGSDGGATTTTNTGGATTTQGGGGQGGDLTPPSCAETATWKERVKLVGNDTVGGDGFGFSVAADGDTVIIGARYAHDDVADLDSGAAYVFVREGDSWSQQAKLVKGDHPFDAVGHRVALAGDTAFVSAPGYDEWTGAVHVFTRNGRTWTHHQTLRPSDVTGGSFFGNALALHGQTLLVGRGASVYVFESDGGTWVEVDKIVSSELTQSMSPVAFDGTNALAGAPTDSEQAQYAGAAQAFRRDASGWIASPKLVPSDPSAGASFGSGLAVLGNTILVGAPHSPHPDVVGQSGSVYLFRQDLRSDPWVQEGKFQAHQPSPDDRFGYTIALSDDLAVVGAPGHPFHPACTTGAIHVLLRDGDDFSEKARIVGADVGECQQFGAAVAVSGCTVFAGGAYTNAVYVFE